MIKVGELNKESEILKNIENDKNKYVFEYEYDICYDDLYNDNNEDYKKLEECHRNEDEAGFIKYYNKLSEENAFGIIIQKVIEFNGPGGGWPVCICTSIPMTLENFYYGYMEGILDEVMILERVKE